MNVIQLTEPFEHILIQGLCSKEELLFIDQEIISLYPELLPPESTNAATEDDGKGYKKSGKGIFLDYFYQGKRKDSKILDITRKVFSNPQIRESVLELSKKSIYFKLFLNTRKDSTILQYYGDGDYYKSHIDKSIFTVVFTHYIRPKRFYGGNLRFPEFDYVVPFDYNSLLIFPSCIDHEVLPVTLISKDSEMSGRFSITNLVE
jgi:hypothetical protein